MPIATTDDNVDLYYETTGNGVAIVFIHEFAGDITSWEGQLRHFGARYQCLAFCARGYPPSSVPNSKESYSQDRAVADVIAVMDHAGIEKAHIVGLSMGGFAALHLGMQYPDRVRSLCAAGAGYGAEPDQLQRFRDEASVSASFLLEQGMQAFAESYAVGPTRLPFKQSNPRGFEEFKAQLGRHSALGSANTQLGVQRERPSLYTLTDKLSRIRAPTLILNGDEDWPCLAPGLMLKATIPTSALAIIPNCGHTINLEAEGEFNRVVGDFLTYVDSGRWPKRVPLAPTGSITGMTSSAKA